MQGTFLRNFIEVGMKLLIDEHQLEKHNAKKLNKMVCCGKSIISSIWWM